MTWKPWFAWFPVVTLSGRWMWMARIQRRWNPNINFKIIDTYDWGDYHGGWEFKEKEPA